jgi:hypothetical protein
MIKLNWKEKKPRMISVWTKKENRNIQKNIVLHNGENEISESDWELIRNKCNKQLSDGSLEIISRTKKKSIPKNKKKSNIKDKEE